MIRNWKALGLNTILLAAFATPALAAPEDIGKDDKAPATVKDIKELGKSINLLGETLNLHIKHSLGEIDALKKQVEALQKDIDSLKKGTTSTSNYGPAAKDIDELRKQIDRLQQTCDAIKKQLPVTTTALKPSGTARLELVNDYPYQIDFVVNEATYPIAPGMTRVLNLPVGSNYTFRIPQLAGYQANQSRTLPADGRVIRVYTLQ